MPNDPTAMNDRLLLHVCCAPCSIAVIDELRRGREVTAFFYNPNIHPPAEYEKRKAEVARVCRQWGIPVADQDREAEVWETRVAGISQDKENGPRCQACIALRLAKAAAYARDNGFAVLATSLSSSRRKDTAAVNASGRAIAAEFGLDFLSEDWKKGGRQEKAEGLIAEHRVYRQDYCGCRFSLAARDRRRSRAKAA